MTMYHERKSLIFLILLLLIPFSTPRDTITTGQTLKDGEVLVSDHETFALGFFSPGMSKNRYLGIWYNKVSENAVVWVANRDSPINDTSGVLSFENSGNLVVHGADLETPVWSTNFSGLGNDHSAQLLDTGNLVVFGKGRNGIVTWQSFDYPTDTSLSTMKVGANWKIGLNWTLTSWKSPDDPGTGEYSYRIDLGEYPEFSLYKGLDRIWRAGAWNGVRLGGVPEMVSTGNFAPNITYVDNQDEVYLVSSMRDPTIYLKMVVNSSGVMERMVWNLNKLEWVVFWSAPKVRCDIYNHCGPNGNCDSSSIGRFECSCLPGFEPNSSSDWILRDGSGGCVRKRDSNVCRNGEGFIKLSGLKIPDSRNIRVNWSMGLKACEQECLRDCKCMGYTSANISGAGSGCVIWNGDLMDTRELESHGQDFFLRADAYDVEHSLKAQHSSSKKGKVTAMGASVGAAVLLTAVLLCWLTKKLKEKRKRAKFLFSQDSSFTSRTLLSRMQFNESETNTDLPFFDLSTLVEATDSFSFNNKLGEGGFGSVYKGTLKCGQEVAVKRLSTNSGQGVDEFKNEANIIAKLQHRNLVRLLGYCAQQEEKMLIYEYMPNKSLDSLICGKTKGSCLDWAQRYSIILGIARGLVYLHHDSRLRIIHRDLKASNVLLDSAMKPKISDFGMARIFGVDQIEANTSRVVGTYGYMSPEYAMEGVFSTKSDVFSFGVVLLEIISGRKNTSYYQENSVNLIGHVWSLWREERALEVVDPCLGDSYSAKEIFRCIHVGLLCVQEQAIDRPTMSDVVLMLCNETALPPPGQPAFIFKITGQYSSSASIGARSFNDITLSVTEAR